MNEQRKQMTLENIFNIKEKVVVITGATGYLGRYITEAFLEVNARVIILGKSDKIHDLAEKYQSKYSNNKVIEYQVDFYNREELNSVLNSIITDHDVDVLINNAYDFSSNTGFNTESGKFEYATYEHWHNAFESGIYWAVLTAQVIGNYFINTNKKGSIINISSMYGLVAPSPDLYSGTDFLNPPSYSVNKAGLIALTRYIASFWGGYGIRCNAVAPGPFPNIEHKASNSVDPNDFFIQRLNERTALKRTGHPSELSGLLIYLATEASSYMTGQTLSIDGGWTIT